MNRKKRKKTNNGGGDDKNHPPTTTTQSKKDLPTTKKRKHPSSIPQRDEYASVLDYLEAKYVQGVMIQDDDDEDHMEGGKDEGEGNNDNDEEEDRGSVYSSDDDFLDDSLLQRDVTEQVLSQSIHTKLEAEGDDDFFVNVGNLEVEDRDNLMDYDPLKDVTTTQKELKKVGAKKKRKPKTTSTSTAAAAADDAATTASSSTKKSTTAKKKKSSSVESSKRPTTTTSKSSSDPKMSSPDKKKMKKSSSSSTTTTLHNPKKMGNKKKPTMSKQQQYHLKALKQKATERKADWKKIYTKVVKRIKKLTHEDLPVKRQTIKLTVVTPANKKGGDTIQFSNPHVKGQKLRVRVPKDGGPGTKFNVKVPAPPLDDDAPTDNRFPRDVQELLDDYSQSYDGWCQAQADYYQAAPGDTKFTAHKERMMKFDNLLKIFPPNLITPINAVYLRKVVRRARQNKHKRLKTEAALAAAAASSSTKKSAKPDNSDNEDDNEDGDDDDKEEQEHNKKNPPTIDLVVPVKSSSFPEIQFNLNDFYKDWNTKNHTIMWFNIHGGIY